MEETLNVLACIMHQVLTMPFKRELISPPAAQQTHHFRCLQKTEAYSMQLVLV